MIESRQGTGSRREVSPGLAAAMRTTLERIEADREQAPEDVAELLGVIAEHLYERGFDLGELKRICSPSPETLWRFRHRLGLGIRAYVDQRLLETAWHVVAESAVPISEVAAALGFEEPEPFRKWFRRRTGQAPTKLRAAKSGRAKKVRPSARRLAAAVWRSTLLGELGRDEYFTLIRSLQDQYPAAFLPREEENP